MVWLNSDSKPLKAVNQLLIFRNHADVATEFCKDKKRNAIRAKRAGSFFRDIVNVSHI